MGLRKAGGNWVAGDRFFDREVEIEALMERVEDGIHTLVTAQRRMGKTSLVRELLRRLEEWGDFETVFVDLEDASTAADAVVEIAAASLPIRGIVTRVKDWVRKSSTATVDRLDELGVSELRVKLRAGIDAGRWRTQGDALFASLAASERPVVLAIDELPILVNRLLKGHDYEITPERRQDTDGFLSWLRKNAQAHRDRVRLVVSGSVGLEHYQSRLRMVLGDDGYGVALELLTEAAVSDGRLTDDSIRQYEVYRSVLSEEAGGQIRDILHVLEHDGYLVRHDEGYRFVSGLVEDWWRARNSRGFVPFDQRQT